ncbi:MAG TPA: hypothetical protein PKC11_11700 [Agitococcus sp.]|jgi:hypothetical protein|nr:hypothetical protein [Agitococcus sp.]
MINEIKVIFDKFPERSKAESWSPSTDWTSAVKRSLCDLAASKNLASCASIDNADYSEWLYDVVWLETQEGAKDTTNVIDCVLVCESEWGNVGHIRDDFQKLLLAKADYRLMIFQANSLDGFNKILLQLKEQICLFKKSVISDRYLFVGYIINEERFEYQEFVYANI